MNGNFRNAQQKEVFYQRLIDLVLDYGTCLYVKGLCLKGSPEHSKEKDNEALDHFIDIKDLLQDFLWD